MSDSIAECSMTYRFRLRTAKPGSRPGRWINAGRKFSTLESAESAARSAARELAMRSRCRTELELLAEAAWME